MMKGEHYLEEPTHRDIKLNEVFNKITDILHQQSSVTPTKQKMTCDVIESILPDRSTIPIIQGKTPHCMPYAMKRYLTLVETRRYFCRINPLFCQSLSSYVWLITSLHTPVLYMCA